MNEHYAHWNGMSFTTKINRLVWRITMSRLWMKYILIISLLLCGFYLYKIINEREAELKVSKETPSVPNVFVDDIHQAEYKLVNNNKKCDVVHIAMVCAGYNSTQSLVTVIKSIIYYRSRPIHFHLIVDEISMRTLKTLFNTWNLPQVKVSLHSAEIWIPKVSWIPNKHYSGVYGLLKLIFPDALSQDKVLALDTDITVLTDISLLWDEFDNFKNNNMIGLVENQSNWYIKKLSYGQSIWPAIGRGFNTGIMLMNLKKLREFNFNKIWTKITQQVLMEVHETILADQDIMNSVIKKYSDIVVTLDCVWNVQLSDHTLSETCYKNSKQIKILHWNSPRKQEVQNKHAIDFNRMHKVFLEMDGNLLRRQLFQCSEIKVDNNTNQFDDCTKFTMGSSIVYRTHLYFFEYQYNLYTKSDVALVTQCSADRISLLDEFCQRWPGTISITLYLTDAEVQYFINYIRSSENLRKRKNIAYHIVYKDGEFYPINYLRNIGTSELSTSFIFQVDVDFLLQHNLYENLISYIIKFNLSEVNNTALIVPAFETQRYRFTFPSNKEELLKYLNYGVIYTFRYHVWTRGHAATNYSNWKTAIVPYEVTWEPDFEPYVVVSKKAPQFDQRFIGFGWNKVSFITHLTALGYKYIVLPDAFIIHRPHAPSLDIAKFRTNTIYRRCLKRLKDKFVDELINKYGKNALSKLQNISKD